jgi:hypothetical protein
MPETGLMRSTPHGKSFRPLGHEGFPLIESDGYRIFFAQ